MVIGELELRNVHWQFMFGPYALGPSEIAKAVDETASSCAPLQIVVGVSTVGATATVGVGEGVGEIVNICTGAGIAGGGTGVEVAGAGVERRPGVGTADDDETTASNPAPFTLPSETNSTTATVSATTTSEPLAAPEND